MKKLLIAIVVLASMVLSFAPTSVSAHELLPTNVTEYIEDNPNATPEEIRQFISGNAPEFSDKVKNQQDLINIVNQKTSFLDNSLDFIKLGFQHILSGPDHILFVLSLLLVFVGIRTVMKYTITFTLAHSITLILAGTGFLTLSSDIVEPIIALSIAVVAITTVFFKENQYLKNPKYKLAVVFFFGLFHGLGFAGLLEEIRIPDDKYVSSLLSFNVGIEIGQLFIVALALPLIYLLRNKSWYPILIKVMAVAISLIAVFWTVQRIIVS